MFQRCCKPAMLAQSIQFIIRAEGCVSVFTTKKGPSLTGASSNKHFFFYVPFAATIGDKDRRSSKGAAI